MRQDSNTKFVIKHFAIQKMDADDLNKPISIYSARVLPCILQSYQQFTNSCDAHP